MKVLEGEGGYRLASELEARSVWRQWLGDEQPYMELRSHLMNASAWAAFMRSSSSLRLQLKVRALLFDKALGFPEAPLPSTQLNPNYFQLQPDSVYFSLEEDASEARFMATGKYGLDSRDNMSHQVEIKQKTQQRKAAASTPKQGRTNFRNADHSKGYSRVIPTVDSDIDGSDLWYDQWYDKQLRQRIQHISRRLQQQKLPFPDQDALKRTPESMASFLTLSAAAERRHSPFLTDDKSLRGQEITSSMDLDLSILPEYTFFSNSVPENPCPAASEPSDLPYSIETCSSYPEAENSLLSSPLGQKVTPLRKPGLSKEEAEALTKQTVGKILESQGFDSVRQTCLDVLTEVTACHMRKLARWLRTLLDSYQKHISTDEILRMFLHKLAAQSFRLDHDPTNSLRDLAEYVRNEKARLSPLSNHMQQLQQLQGRGQLTVLQQQSMYLEKVFKRKQLPSLRNIKREDNPVMDNMKSYGTTTLTKQPWISPQMPTISHLMPLQQQNTKFTNVRMDGLQDILASDAKQETTEDLEGNLGSPNKRKRKDY